MFCLPDIRPCVLDHGQVTKHFREFLWLCTLFTTTTQMQGLSARLGKPVATTNKRVTKYTYYGDCGSPNARSDV